MRRAISVLTAILCLLCSSTAAQNEPKTTFKATTELVLVPAVVTHDRQPIRNLKQDDFLVLQDGKPQKISVFEEVDEVGNFAEEAPAGPQTITNYRSSRIAPTILLLDFLNMTFLHLSDIRKQFADVVQVAVETKTPVEVLALSWNGLVEIMPSSGDGNDLLQAALRWKKMKNRQVPPGASRMKRMPGPDGIAQLIEIYGVTPDKAPIDVIDHRTQIFDKRTMEFAAVEQIAQAYRMLPGRKKLVWITSDIPMYLRQAGGSQLSFDNHNATELRAIKSLIDANIAIYPVVNMEPVAAGWYERDPHRSYCGPPNPRDHWSFYVIYESGGDVCDDAPQNCVRKAVNDAKHYYVLGYYLGGDTEPGWHKLNVKVTDPRIDVRAKRAFLVGYQPGPNGILDSEEKFIEAAAKTPLDYTALPLSLHWEASGAEGEGRKLDLTVRAFPGSVKMDDDLARLNVRVLIYATNIESGKTESYDRSVFRKVTSEEQQRLKQNEFQFQTSLVLPAGEYEVKVLVRDTTTTLIGTVTAQIDLSERRRLVLPE